MDNVVYRAKVGDAMQNDRLHTFEWEWLGKYFLYTELLRPKQDKVRW